MDRRQFVGVGVGALVSGALAACASRRTTPSPAALPTVPLDAAAFRAERKFVETQFGRIAYVERGSGNVALFLHGYPLNGFQWRGAIERLSPYRRCVAHDFMGLGASEVPQGQSVAPDAQVAMLAEFLGRLSIAQVDLVGNDSGGAAAQLFMTRYPQRVRTLLLTNCDAEPDSPPPSLLPIIAEAKKGEWTSGSIGNMLRDKTLARSAKGIGGITYAYPTDPTDPTDEAIEMYFAPLVSSPLRQMQCDAYVIALEKNPLAGIAPLLKRSTVPTRIVWGAADSVFSKESPGWLDRTLGNSRGVRFVPDAKLFFPEEFPDIIAEEARRLWGVA